MSAVKIATQHIKNLLYATFQGTKRFLSALTRRIRGKGQCDAGWQHQVQTVILRRQKQMLKFAISSTKTLEALAFVAQLQPGLTPKYVAKIFFYAEKWHLNRYGRPIVADTYIAMAQGPVPSTIKNLIDENWQYCDKPEMFDSILHIEMKQGLRRLNAKRAPDMSRLSESDRECLEEAIAFCKDKSSDDLSNLTHQEKAWMNADFNRPMDYEDFIDDNNPHREAIIEAAKEASRSAVF